MLFALVAAGTLACLCGCCNTDGPRGCTGPGVGCGGCAAGGCGAGHGRRARRTANGPNGPAVGAVSYPYYTTRGPRDFLDPNPPSIGP